MISEMLNQGHFITFYTFVAMAVAIALLIWSLKHPWGTIILSLVWVVLIPAAAYFLVKKYCFKRHGPSEKYWELEATGIFAFTAFLVLLAKSLA